MEEVQSLTIPTKSFSFYAYHLELDHQQAQLSVFYGDRSSLNSGADITSTLSSSYNMPILKWKLED